MHGKYNEVVICTERFCMELRSLARSNEVTGRKIRE